MASSRAISCVLKKNYVLLLRNAKFANSCVGNPFALTQIRLASQKQIVKSDQNNAGNQVSTSFAETVKENTKSAGYLGVIIAGVGITCILFYTVFKELFSSKSPNGVYSLAVKRIESEHNVMEALGGPIKAYGEETRRGRRGHVAHTLFMDNQGKKCMRMKFYVKGTKSSGTVHLEVKENESGDYEYVYFFVQLNNYKKSVFVIEDNRLPEQL